MTRTYQCILRSNAQTDTLYDGTILPVFGITSLLSEPAKIPAKTLYAMYGDSVVLNTRSISQGEHHTIHLHGLDVDTRNDGDPATSFWLEHMEDTTYSFNANYTGLYIYHCHAADVVHVEMGMYGLIVVRYFNGINYEMWPGGPEYHKEYNWLLSELDSSWNYNPPFHDAVMDTVHVPEYNPSHFLINGKGDQEISDDDSIRISGSINEKIILRIGSIGYTTCRIVIPQGLNHQILISDGRPLPNVLTDDTLYIMPGERYEILMQANSALSDSISVYYDDMNTGLNYHSWKIPLSISGFFSVDEIFEDILLLYPNPVTNIITIKTTEKGKLSIYDATSKFVYSQTHSSGNIEINISTWSSGIYFAEFETENGIFREKIIKN